MLLYNFCEYFYDKDNNKSIPWNLKAPPDTEELYRWYTDERLSFCIGVCMINRKEEKNDVFNIVRNKLGKFAV